MPGIAGQAHFTYIHDLNTGWMAEAACQHHPDVDWFDTDCGLMTAATICYACPVKQDCLNYAIDIDVDEGIWAGLWGGQLQALKRRRLSSPA